MDNAIGDTLISFKVVVLPPSIDTIINFPGGNGDGEHPEAMFRKMAWKAGGDSTVKIWQVAGIKKDTMIKRNPLGEYPHLSQDRCEYLLLVRDGETPIWWPMQLCQAVIPTEGAERPFYGEPGAPGAG